MKSLHWWTELVKCLKHKYDMVKESIDAYSQFSRFISFPVSAQTHSKYNKK